ncbi:hypothetical protein AB6A40_004878 [Gnathostoma spinigerum]|uniref:Uncharacterized protein n=1 Tax=Gnathostoma spinigerum TaxID=75299 RepID=A0ABD6ELI2_9BILA
MISVPIIRVSLAVFPRGIDDRTTTNPSSNTISSTFDERLTQFDDTVVNVASQRDIPPLSVIINLSSITKRSSRQFPSLIVECFIEVLHRKYTLIYCMSPMPTTKQ